MQRRRFVGAGGLMAGACLMLALAGCGGSPDLGGYSQSSSFSSGLSSGYGGYGSGGYGSGYGGAGGYSGGLQGAGAVRGQGTYAKIEVSFELPNLHGDPFDYAENDVQVAFSSSDGRTTRVPAFYDGGTTWRARFTPDTTGRLTVSAVTLNRARVDVQKMEPRELTVSGSAQPGFVRRDPRSRTRFAFDNGTTYFPIGADAEGSNVAEALQAIGKAGGNWSRVPMSKAGGTDLGRAGDAAAKPGEISLDVAKKWDAIVDSAEKASVDFQMVLQQHTPWSTRGAAQWAENPWNKANGGWLRTPDEFFSNPRTVALTRAKLRYAIARWGYSTAVMAWELFDQVDLTDAVYHKHGDEVAAWHRDMAEFIRQQDPFHHLVTTSATRQMADVWSSMDYFQERVSGPDAIAQIAGIATRSLDRPVFLSLVPRSTDTPSDAAAIVHEALWSGLAGDFCGAGQLSSKSDVASFQGATDFVRASGVASHRGLTRTDASVETAERTALAFRPGGGPLPAKQTEWLVSPSGAVEGLAAMPSVLPGAADRQRFRAATFKVSFAEAGTFAVSVGRVSKEGAALALSVDGAPAASKLFAATSADTDVDATVEAKVTAGQHTVRVENTGAGWLGLQRFRLAPYAPALAAIGKADKTYAVQWIYRREAPSDAAGIKGKVTLPGMQAGSYRATWWDTANGKTISDETVEATKSGTLSITTPAVTRDVAVYVERVNPSKAKQQSARGGRNGGGAGKYPSPSASAPAAGSTTGQ